MTSSFSRNFEARETHQEKVKFFDYHFHFEHGYFFHVGAQVQYHVSGVCGLKLSANLQRLDL